MTNRLDALTVLVVDPRPQTDDDLPRIIDELGCHGISAGRGDEALAAIEQGKAQIVLLDPDLPDMDGLTLLSFLHRNHPHIPVIVCSAGASLEAAVAAMRQGAWDFIARPLELPRLRQSLQQALEILRLEPKQPGEHGAPNPPGVDQRRIHTIIDALPTGVLVTDALGRAVLLNPSFRRFMDLSETTVPGGPVEDYIQDHELRRLVLEISRGDPDAAAEIPAYEFSTRIDQFLMARGKPVLNDQNVCQGAVITITDVTAMKILDRLKSEFIAKVSHELRSPLSTIHEQLALVLGDLAGQLTSADEHLLSRAKEKTQGLISLIGDLLDLSRIESGAVCQEPRAVALDELLENIIDFLSPQASAKHQQLILSRPNQPLPVVKCDPLALESIFGNLITNAINYTPPSGRIEIKLDLEPPNLRVRVIDNGFGIEPRHLEKIFERFYRVKNEQTRYITGTGLGLPIVKELVDSLGGRIQVESTPEQGSAFTVLLPVDANQ